MILDGEAFTDGVVLLMAESDAPFKILKHQHFTNTPRSLVVTNVDSAARRFYELERYPAIDAYARALGLTREQVTGEVTFSNTITFSVNGEPYVRSIQSVDETDGSIVLVALASRPEEIPMIPDSERAEAAEKTVEVLKSKVKQLYNEGNKTTIHRQLERAQRRQEANECRSAT